MTQVEQDINKLAGMYYDKKLGITSLHVLLKAVPNITAGQLQTHYRTILGYAEDHVNENAGCLDKIQQDIHTTGKFNEKLWG